MRETLKVALAVAVAAAATGFVRAGDPALVPDPPRMERRVIDLERRVAELEALLARAPAPTPTWAPAPVARAAQGHTHTCANGHTWDHSVTSGHNCPVCGLFQNVQDATPRAVTTGGATYALPSSGGCANGSCSSGGSAARFGLFRRR